jgi:cell wall-associated NlpC family hydrolase
MRSTVRALAAVLAALALTLAGAVLSASGARAELGADPGPDPIAPLAAAWRDARAAAGASTFEAALTGVRAHTSTTTAVRAQPAGPAVAAAIRAGAREARAVADTARKRAAEADAAEGAARAAVIAAVSQATGAPVEALAAEWSAAPPRALDVLVAGLTQLGKPYRYGGPGPDGYDCSGFVAAAFSAVGVDLPHNSAAQWELAAPVDVAQAGDVWIAPHRGHIGLALGAGLLLHSPRTGDVVRIVPVFPGYAAGRIPVP